MMALKYVLLLGCASVKELTALPLYPRASTKGGSTLRFPYYYKVQFSSSTSPLPSHSVLFATRADKADGLFPSDDSDYSSLSDGAAATEDKQQQNKDVPPEMSSSTFQSIGSLHSISNPIDIIADWISDRFKEQSLQQQQRPESGIGNAEIKSSNDEGEASKYILESYSPGSTLDVIAQASNTYTPLSYQVRTIVRVILPSILFGAVATSVYPSMAQWLVQLPSSTYENSNILYNDQVLTVLSNDLSQYVQNILTTCALLFGILVGQTYYFMYQQQENIFYALFDEVTEAKSLLEQISLMTYGRPGLYPSLLSRMNDYVQDDLKMLSVKDPTLLTSRLPRDDPLESILYATSVGLPGVVYETVKSLRQARAERCSALQNKLPLLHIYLLRLLIVIVLATFPVCGSGSQAIATNILLLQSYMFGVLAFGLTLVVNVVEELRNSRNKGAYNVDGVLEVMVGGLEKELEERLDGRFWGIGVSPSPPVRDITDRSNGTVIKIDADNFDGVKKEIAKISEVEEQSNFWAEADGSVAADKGSKTTPRRKRVTSWLQRKILRKANA
mmetsp:Transcript_19845/g.30243  ORF Transcript_19845/g.30243 Transcript_19845/m.30243 type:complete len:559 (+) Transcript_19845:52-1728(+)